MCVDSVLVVLCRGDSVPGVLCGENGVLVVLCRGDSVPGVLCRENGVLGVLCRGDSVLVAVVERGGG